MFLCNTLKQHFLWNAFPANIQIDFFSVLYNIAESVSFLVLCITQFWLLSVSCFFVKSRFFFSIPLFMLFSQNLGSKFWFLVTYMDVV